MLLSLGRTSGTENAGYFDESDSEQSGMAPPFLGSFLLIHPMVAGISTFTCFLVGGTHCVHALG